jgi:uncharacterized protein (DUF58 family)
VPDSAVVVRQHRAEELAAPFPPLLVAAERVANAVAQGVHGRRRIGQGDTFWQFRSYSQNDAAARIDWRASAKSARLYVRESEWEAAQSVWLWRDGSASMDYAGAPDRPTKRARADLLLMALASLLLRGGERLTLLGSGAPPNSGRAVLTRLALGLEGAVSGVPPEALLPRDSQIVLLGDFLGPLGELDVRVAGFAAAGVRGHVLQILDPAEETLPFSGRVRFEGLEGEAPVLMSRAEAVRGAYVDKLTAHRAGLRAIAGAARWTFATHRTDRPAAQALLGLYHALATPRGF